MARLGVIPAAGKGTRWGGFLKELLPVGDSTHLIDHSVRAMQLGGADVVLVVTSVEKISILSRHLGHRHNIPIYYAIQGGDNDIWSAIEESFAWSAQHYLFAMPDTVYPLDAFMHIPKGHFSLGIFETDMPERFGVLWEGQIINKARLPCRECQAWGLLAWSSECVQMWREEKPRDYTHAINLAIDEYGLSKWPVGYYYDMATWADYADLIRETQWWMEMVAA